MGKSYQISGKNDSREPAKFLAANGQVILPIVELIEECKLAVDDVLEVLGGSTLEAVLQISAAGVAGESHRGRLGGERMLYFFVGETIAVVSHGLVKEASRQRIKSESRVV